jgi:pimeloyl-ACP methyl ester carboxylesterase
MTISGLTMVMAFNADGKQAMEPDEEQSVDNGQFRLRGNAPVQDVQLMPQYDDLSLELRTCLERRDQNVEEQDQERDHCPSATRSPHASADGVFGTDKPFELDEFVANLEALRAQLGIKRAHFVGHSLGGMIAPAYAHAHPDRVKSICLISTAAFRGPEAKANLANFVRRIDAGGPAAVVDTLLDRWSTDRFRHDRPDIVAGRKEQVLKLNSCVYRETYNVFATAETGPWLSEIGMPALMMTGEFDAGCGPALNAKMAEALPRSERAQDRRTRVGTALRQGEPVSEEDCAWFLKAYRIGMRQVLMRDMLPSTFVALFVACYSTCIFGTVGAWMPLYLASEKGWSTAEYSAFYVSCGIVGFFGLWLASWLADRVGRRAGFIVTLLEGAMFLVAWIYSGSRLLLWVFGLAWSFGFLGFRGASTVLTAEIFPTRVRGVANGVVWAIAYFVGFVLWPFVTVALQQATGSFKLALLCISAFMVLMAIGVWLWVPEHAGKDLNEISI